MWDEERKIFRMWYSAGGFWEPDQIGYAESEDGIHWKKHPQMCIRDRDWRNDRSRQELTGI